MAKFAVGDRVELIRAINKVNLGLVFVIHGIDPHMTKMLKEPWYYLLGHPGPGDGAPESALRKLPPDSHADTTTEDPGVTRLKKLLQQDAVKVKAPVKA